MKITVIGTGYVGLVSGTCFAEMGNNVTCVDIDEKKINNLKNGIIPIYEPGLTEMVIENKKIGTLFFSTSLEEAIKEAEIVFIAVGTPPGKDGSADLQFVLSVASDIGKYMQNDLIVVNKSTVPVGTGDLVSKTIEKELNKRNIDIPFSVVSNPEFLKEGAAVEDFMRPDRVVIGTDNKEAMEKMKKLYYHFAPNHDSIIGMDLRSAEMTKYAANAMLATKISFMNEMSNIAESVGADIEKVRLGIGSDSRIGFSFIYPGCGYGGSCFPKDVKALVKLAEKNNVKASLITSVEEVNNRQKYILSQKVVKKFGENLKGKTFGVWGLSFKPDTDDMREAPSIILINELIKRGAEVKVYDPKAVNEAKTIYLKDVEVEYCDSKYDALTGSDALILVTEWKEFRMPDFIEIKNRLKTPVIIDGRNQYDIEQLEELGFEYYCIGR